MGNNIPAPGQLSVEQAQRYWAQVIANLKTMQKQVDSTTPETEALGPMVEELTGVITQHLIAANALFGHYTMLIAEHNAAVRHSTSAPAAGGGFVPATRAGMPGAAAPLAPAGQGGSW